MYQKNKKNRSIRYQGSTSPLCMRQFKKKALKNFLGTLGRKKENKGLFLQGNLSGFLNDIKNTVYKKGCWEIKINVYLHKTFVYHFIKKYYKPKKSRKKVIFFIQKFAFSYFSV
ncbi:hypothetical protein CSB09_02930 [Candidatus Gracilibacteria bacterium]|nr:MAG: hypothetical protein CSB09_02930 [Candidatus Gracilibacteria bacterium]